MAILLILVGRADRDILPVLKDRLEKAFGKEITIGKAMPEPDYALNRARGQYLSTSIINAIMDEKEYRVYERILGVVGHDLYAEGLNFVFGEAGGRAAVIGLERLREGFYGGPEDKSLFKRRVITEAVHELGHTYGLGHCTNPSCVMYFSNTISDTDRKGAEFCRVCKKRLIRGWGSEDLI